LVKVEVSVAQKWFGQATRIPDWDGRKKACLGHYKKRILRHLEKDGFFALFEMSHKTVVPINKDRGFIKTDLFVLCQNGPKTGSKKISCQTYHRLQIWKFF
jgi:hypothetical protein